jgi:glucan biosynthesis protein C
VPRFDGFLRPLPITVAFDLERRAPPHPSTASPAILADERRTDLDWLRIAAFGMLILFHVGMFYAPADWELKSTRLQPWLTVVLEWSAPWRLLLLFAVSGAATAFMLRRLDPVRLLRARSAYLLRPLLFAALVVVPPQVYFEVVAQYGFTGSFWSFLAYYYTGGFCHEGHCHLMPHWEHMWFVAYLWIYTALLAVLLALWKGLPDRLDRLAHRLLAGPNLLVVPALALGLAHGSLGHFFPETHALTDDWYLHATFFAVFVFGFTCLGNREIMRGLEGLRWVALALAIVAYASRSGYAWHYRDGSLIPLALKLPMSFVYGLDQWAWFVAAFGFAHRWLVGRDGPLRRYLTEAVFPYYIVHQTALVVIAYEVARLRLPLALEAAAIVVGCVLSCALTFELVRRVHWLRPWFGLKRRDSGGYAIARPPST